MVVQHWDKRRMLPNLYLDPAIGAAGAIGALAVFRGGFGQLDQMAAQPDPAHVPATCGCRKCRSERTVPAVPNYSKLGRSDQVKVALMCLELRQRNTGKSNRVSMPIRYNYATHAACSVSEDIRRA